jgi:hypothetical protein
VGVEGGWGGGGRAGGGGGGGGLRLTQACNITMHAGR